MSNFEKNYELAINNAKRLSDNILIDGKIIAAAQEERFTRIKHDSSFPKNAGFTYVPKSSKLAGFRALDPAVVQKRQGSMY